MARKYDFEERKYVIGGIAVLIVLVFIIRLFVLQILTDDYKKYAASNAFLERTQYPSRGVIYDRNGELLAYNQPAYDVMLIMRFVRHWAFLLIFLWNG